jgi:signal transduction histidine kinase
MRASTIATLFFLAAASLSFFAWVLRQVSADVIVLNVTADMQDILRANLEDEKRLGRIDPANAAAYRARFDREQALLRRLQILDLTQRELDRRIEAVLIAAVALILFAGAALHLLQQRSREQRLARLGAALEAMSRGRSGAPVGDSRRDVIGRIARMIDDASALVASNRRRIQVLEHLSAWQEAARRHVHEIRTPLTAAQLELERLVATVERRDPSVAAEIRDAESSILEELDHLGRFTSAFASFATIAPPQMRPHDLRTLLADFCDHLAPMWPNLVITLDARDDCCVAADREMIRQVLVNIISNSALAAPAGGKVFISARTSSGEAIVDVSDDGPGVAPEIRERLFEPYTTTRRIGEGMGLGLSISKKIMLDHGGDLDFVDTRTGATFRLTFPLFAEAK